MPWLVILRCRWGDGLSLSLPRVTVILVEPRLDRKWWALPAWVGYPLMFLGLVFLFFFPFGMDWYGYGSAVFIALVLAVRLYPRYRIELLAKSKHGAVTWTRRVRKGEPPPPKPFVHWPVEDADDGGTKT